MKKVLVIYYTQSGQLNKALKATLKPLEDIAKVQLYYEQLKPKIPFPFPWSYMEFFDAFPETVQGVPCELESFEFNPEEDFDLVIIAYQPWFLSISRPVNSFLQTPQAKIVLKNKPVVTVIACRNMWLNAQQKMKINLKKLEANLVGNITFVDKASNLVSLITVLAFALGGVKDKFLGVFPKYGVSDKDLDLLAGIFGEIILKNLKSGDYSKQQQELINQGAINIKSNLMLMEGRGSVLFPLYANFISKKGASNSRERRTRVRIFGIVLPTAILILSPIITIVSRLAPVLFPKKIKKEIERHSLIH
ncbi:MAG: dialkylresorcinol condensing enzyme DarA [Bacteroidetes bacterium]|nr:dialkylresorcinol condensing enzyme DarA [Bacteroidota bacterium]HET6244612.1 dialkylresorcinol condensing enzyme DarA [Bacteroidia bacterium]